MRRRLRVGLGFFVAEGSRFNIRVDRYLALVNCFLY